MLWCQDFTEIDRMQLEVREYLEPPSTRLDDGRQSCIGLATAGFVIPNRSEGRQATLHRVNWRLGRPAQAPRSAPC